MSVVVEELEQRIGRRLGLHSLDCWRARLPEVVQEAQARHGCTAADLLVRLDQDPQLLVELAEPLTVGETHFFRHPPQLATLLDWLVERTWMDGPVTVWSAGCSTGEEPYSVAIALTERLGSWVPGRFRILGTDLNRQAIQKAQRAQYRAWSFRGAPAWLLGRYFQVLPQGEHLLRPEVASLVEFNAAPLAEHAAALPARSLDAILFRNVGIYLRDDALTQLLRMLARVLKPDGLLLVGPSDPLVPEELFERVGPVAHCLYRPHPAPPPAPRPRPRTVLSALLPPRPPPAPDPWDTLAAQADQGALEETLRRVELRLFQDQGRSVPGLLLRGQLLLSLGRAGEALADLRHVVVLDPGHRQAGFWCALALHASGLIPESLGLLEQLQAGLAQLPASTLLEDGCTTARELRETAALLRQQWG